MQRSSTARPNTLRTPSGGEGKTKSASTSKLKASKKLAFKSPLHLSLRKSAKTKKCDPTGEQQSPPGSVEKQARMRLPRPSATSLDQILSGFKYTPKKGASAVPKSVPSTPSNVASCSSVILPEVASRKTPQTRHTRSKSDGDEAKAKALEESKEPVQTGVNRFGYPVSAITSPAPLDSSSDRRYHTLPTMSASKKVLKRLKAISSLPSTPRPESPAFPSKVPNAAPKTTTVEKSSDPHTKNKRSSNEIGFKQTSARGRGRRRPSAGSSRRDTSATSSTSFSTSTSSSGPRRHHCDLMGPPHKRTRSRTSSSTSRSTGVSSLCYSRATPISSSRESLSAARRLRGVNTTPRQRKGRSRLQRGVERSLEYAARGVKLKEDGLARRKPDALSFQAFLASAEDLKSIAHDKRISDRMTKALCDRNNNSDCATLESSKEANCKDRFACPCSLQRHNEEALVLGPIFPASPLRTLPDGSSDGYCFTGGRSVSPMEPRTDMETSDCCLKSTDCSESFLPPELCETVVHSAFELPVSSSSVISQDCCPHHCFTASEGRVDGIGCSSANTSTCSLASGGFSTGLDSNSVPELHAEKTKNGKKGVCSPMHHHPASPGHQNHAKSWLRNRSFFLRLIESRRKQHKREWESKKGQCLSDSRLPQAMQRDGVLQEMVDELDEAKSIIKSQESEIDELRSEIAKIREGAIEEECYRVEAEIYRVRAENESRIFKATISDLQERLTRAERHEQAPESHDNDLGAETQTRLMSQIGDGAACRATTPEYPQPDGMNHDQGYFSMKRKAGSEETNSPLAVRLSFASNEDATRVDSYCQTDWDEGIKSIAEDTGEGTEHSAVGGNAICPSRGSFLQQSAVKALGPVLMSQLFFFSSLVGKIEPDTIEAEILLRRFVIPAWSRLLAQRL